MCAQLLERQLPDPALREYTGVIINEAVELVKRFSTDESPRFVNGVLSAIAREVRPEDK